MFGCVEEHSQNVAGKPDAANGTGDEELSFRHRFQATQRVFYADVNERKQLLGSDRWKGRVALPPDCGQLFIPEGLPPGIGEESVKASADVSQMKPDRGGSAWLMPQLVCGQATRCFAQIFTGLQQGVRRRHEQGRNTLYGATQPEFRAHLPTDFRRLLESPS
jgi:hypothetical protein